jgi:ABC-type transport system involved in multi-copper enzyme maturation permease subunit
VAFCSDRPIVVLTRRELATFFYSPIAYIVLIGLTCVAWIYFWLFLSQVVIQMQRGIPVVEPIVQHYIFGLFPVILMIFVVPVLTMRLLSEEKRTGTLEVLLTAPVNETAVVLSKFLASLVFLLLAWLPWGLFLVALRVEDGKPFDFRPLLSFGIAMTFMGAGFMSMGLFFSSLTRNQIASAVLAFVGMILLTGLALIEFNMENSAPTNPWVTVLAQVSYLELWIHSLEGQLNPRLLVYHLSATVLWLFMTVKVLESRRWS